PAGSDNSRLLTPFRFGGKFIPGNGKNRPWPSSAREGTPDDAITCSSVRLPLEIAVQSSLNMLSADPSATRMPQDVPAVCRVLLGDARALLEGRTGQPHCHRNPPTAFSRAGACEPDKRVNSCPGCGCAWPPCFWGTPGRAVASSGGAGPRRGTACTAPR